MNGALQEEDAGAFSPFTVPVEHAGDPIGVDFRGVAASGNVRVELVGADGQVVWQEEAGGPAPFAITTVVNPPAAGEYTLRLVWDGALTLQYALKWQPGEIEMPVISPLVLLGGLGMIVVAVGYVVYAAVHKLGWGYLGLGAAAWIVAVVLKLAWAIPINPPVYNALNGALPQALGGPLFWVYVGLLTGIFEVALVWLALRYTRLGQAPWKHALAFGIGFGAVEALLLGVLSLAQMIAALTTPSLFPLDTLAQVALANNPLYGLAAIWERFFTAPVHIFCNVLVFYAVARQQPRWFWLSFAYKTLLDAVAAYGQMAGVATSLGLAWALEILVAVMGAVGYLGIRWIEKRYPTET